MSYGRLFALTLLVAGCRNIPRLQQPSPDMGSPSSNGGDMAQPPGDMGSPPSTSPSTSPSPSPVVTSATIHIHYPIGTHTMALRGDTMPLTWDTGVALTPEADGNSFSYTFPTLTGPVEFKPLLDDATWSHGDNYQVAPGETVDVYPHFFATQGTVKQLWSAFPSKILDYNQPVMVYLPPSYDENTLARYPVLYMQDGQNLFDPTIAFGGNEWKVDETLDSAAESQPATAAIREIIVVGPYAGPDRNNIYTPVADPSEGFGGKGDLYLRMLVEEMKPQVDMMLRTMPEREHTGIMGSSLGGLISAWAGCKYADTFGLTGIVSPSTWWDNNWIISQVQMMTPAPRPLKVYVDSGDSGDSNDDVTQTAMLASAFRGIGYADGSTFDYWVQMGAIHNEVYWAQRFPVAAAFLFPR